MKIYDSTHNFYRKCKMNNLEKFNNSEILNLEVVKNEEFGFFITVDFP